MPNEEGMPKRVGRFKKGFDITRYSSPKGKEPPNFQKVQEARKEMKNKRKQYVVDNYDFSSDSTEFDIPEPVKKYTRTDKLPVKRADRIAYFLDLMKCGYGQREAQKMFMKHFQCSQGTAVKFRKEALEVLDRYTIKDCEKMRSQQIMRLEGLLTQAIENEDLKTANSIIDTINKVAGLYNKPPEVVVAPVMSFSFGDDKTTIIDNNENEETADIILDAVDDIKNKLKI